MNSRFLNIKNSYVLASAVPLTVQDQPVLSQRDLPEDAGTVTLLSFPLPFEGCAQREAVQGGRCS